MLEHNWPHGYVLPLRSFARGSNNQEALRLKKMCILKQLSNIQLGATVIDSHSTTNATIDFSSRRRVILALGPATTLTQSWQWLNWG